ncbi:MAG: nucleoid-associated protein [Bacteroidota bacterium]|nr:nucleoid-associated protein [Bacteroidota bacterium]
MIDLSNIKFEKVVIHKVGNYQKDEGINLSKGEITFNEEIKGVLMKYFLTPFKSEEYYNLYHESDLKMNEVYTYISEIFDNSNNLYPESVNIAQHLYKQSLHPKIKGGEFYVVYFTECRIDDEIVDAIGLFKSENKETFLKVFPQGDNFEINYDEGISINKLDKGCLIFNTERDNGYLVWIVDNVNKGSEAQYWKDDFLRIKPRRDNYHNTENIINLCKEFVYDKLPEEINVEKTDQAELLNKTVRFLKEKPTFSFEEFTEEVIEKPQVANLFKEYKNQFQEDYDIKIEDNFDVSAPALKKNSKVFKSVIKLDKNFHIYIHGDKELITKGYDQENEMNFYKLYYKEES